MLARRVMYTERAKKATPPQKSLRLVLSGVVDCCTICGGWECGCWERVDDEAFWSRFGVSCACSFDVSAFDLELEPHPK